MRTVLNNNTAMGSAATMTRTDRVLSPEIRASDEPAPRHASAVRLSLLPPGSIALVDHVGGRNAPLTPLERRLLELGFVHGERVEVVTEARPGRDPFVVRVGSTTLALRRREVETVWVDPQGRSGDDGK
jgi:ferrous iron transport protein A